MAETRLLVRSARIGYKGPDGLDITRKSGREGLPFAPSWDLLGPYLALRKQDALTPQHWDAYVEAYKAEMRASYRRSRAAWEALLQRDVVTLLCYCTDPTRCHRTVLAGILVKLGARLHPEVVLKSLDDDPAGLVAMIRSVYGEGVLFTQALDAEGGGQ